MNIAGTPVIDREDGEENIYSNVDTIRGTHEKPDPKRNQTSQHQGSECVRNRNFRAVTVCLVLLCVLLLTAVTVLCVLINTNNHQRHNLTEERDQLLTNNTNLTEERDQLLTNNTNLTEERDQLLTNNTNLTEERDQLLTNNTNLKEERNQLLTKINDLNKQNGWTYYQSSLYFISSEDNSWSESRRYCRERGADLVIINNKEKQDFVKSISGGERIWIGLSDSDVEDRWKWVDDSTLNSRFWSSNEPGGQKTENCVVSRSSGWHDYPCNDQFKWICEKIFL